MNNTEYLISKAIGLHKHRLKGISSKKEQIFVEEWHKFSYDLLLCLFTIPCDEKDPDCIDRFTNNGLGCTNKYTNLGPITERDRIVAETIIQWLGTNIGQGFLHECGFINEK